uniref:Uncharacterized protein n=1 Tax=Knipowitschia caucasica TaxID=637954 RepID=A0AAV2M8Z8_KNICA
MEPKEAMSPEKSGAEESDTCSDLTEQNHTSPSRSGVQRLRPQLKGPWAGVVCVVRGVWSPWRPWCPWSWIRAPPVERVWWRLRGVRPLCVLLKNMMLLRGSHRQGPDTSRPRPLAPPPRPCLHAPITLRRRGAALPDPRRIAPQHLTANLTLVL